MLFDAGPRDKTVDLLHHYGVTHLDHFVTSHPDADHIGGAAAVIKAFKVGIYSDSGATHTTKTYENMITALVEEDVTYSELVGGNRWTLGAATVEVLSSGEGSNNNDESVVLRITHDDITFLLPGDKENIKDWEATILVVPHHGSAGVRLGTPPEVALISVGQNNRYGHPAEATLHLLESFDAEIYRTDLNGTITVVSDGKKYTIFTEK
jgi:beta-lactamase superfamily II metal-dependent hydrolase